MFFHSLVSALICGCTTFCCFPVILFIIQFLFTYFPLYCFPLLFQTGVGRVSLQKNVYQTSPRLLLCHSVFISLIFRSFMPFCELSFYFLPPPVVQLVQISISLYFISLVEVFPSFGVVKNISWVSFLVFFWYLLNQITDC